MTISCSARVATSKFQSVPRGRAHSSRNSPPPSFVEVRRQLGFPGSPDKPHAVPAWYALEFAALLQIARWRQAGLPIEEWDLPSVPVAASEILDRLSRSSDLEDAPLSAKVLRIWMRKLAWSAAGITGTEMAVTFGADDDHEFVDRMAQFLLEQVKVRRTV